MESEKLQSLLEPDGFLSKVWKGFEPRPAQLGMLREVTSAFKEGRIQLIEAGTGTGKSLAYLLPAVFWAMTKKEVVVISTHTISLQEQLIHKDIPNLLNALNIELKVALVKGMHNYLCLRKLEDSYHTRLLLTDDERKNLEAIETHRSTGDGSRSGFPFFPTGDVWERVSAEGDTCNGQECPFFSQCYFFKARRNAADADLVVVNHHLLLTDLMKKKENEEIGKRDADGNPVGLLPFFDRLIIDEAHHLEEIATDLLANRVTTLEVVKSVARLTAEKSSKGQGKVPLLKAKIEERYKGKELPTELKDMIQRLSLGIYHVRKELLQNLTDSFNSIGTFLKQNQSEEGGKLRLLGHHTEQPHWKNQVTPSLEGFIHVLDLFVTEHRHLELDMKSLGSDPVQEQTKSLRFDIQGLTNRLEGASAILKAFLKEPQEGEVRWIEDDQHRLMHNVHVVLGSLDVAAALQSVLFKKLSTVVLCSATLTANQNFDFAKRRMGLLGSKRVKEAIFDSPFHYPSQALFAIPQDMKSPQDPGFLDEAVPYIEELLKLSRGNAFILFTSYQMLQDCYERLKGPLQKERYHLLKHGDMGRQALLEKFKSTNRSVLFGTDSFWEGVDVVGDALRLVILVKLPFQVPSDPLIQAKTEKIAKEGGNPFMEYSLPQAIVKFKQGFGRLIRHKKDRGCIVCLDNRMATKPYGKLFINSLPDCPKLIAPRSEVLAAIRTFYGFR